MGQGQKPLRTSSGASLSKYQTIYLPKSVLLAWDTSGLWRFAINLPGILYTLSRCGGFPLWAAFGLGSRSYVFSILRKPRSPIEIKIWIFQSQSNTFFNLLRSRRVAAFLLSTVITFFLQALHAHTRHCRPPWWFSSINPSGANVCWTGLSSDDPHDQSDPPSDGSTLTQLLAKGNLWLRNKKAHLTYFFFSARYNCYLKFPDCPADTRRHPR